MPDVLPEMILAQARRTPDAVAVRCAGRSTTYAHLIGRAGALAEPLRALGARPETRVVVAGERSPDTLAGMLACWLVGAAYVPLDPSVPALRAQQIVEDSGALAAVVGEKYVDLVPSVPRVVLSGSQVHDLEQIEMPPLRPECVAHVLYTSGSTGRPKGVLTTFANITAFVSAVVQWAPGVAGEMRAAGVSSFGFDAATYDLFVPWLMGGSVALVTDAERADPHRLQSVLQDEGVTFGFFTPTLLSVLDPAELPALRTLVCGGEVVGATLAARWSADPQRTFFDAYGPTEATVSQTAIRLTEPRSDPLPIGHSLPNQRVHVLGDDLREVPTGSVGELCLGGPGVARGYLGRPGRTAAAFVPDPEVPGARLYRTGDLVRRHSRDGLVYVGRRDDQVKVRGQRVEPGEVEACLRGAPDVRDVAVVAREATAGTELVAVVAPEQVDVVAVRAYAAERLPDVLVPARVLARRRLPVSSAGKVDRQAVLRDITTPSDPGSAEAQDVLARAWCTALGVASAGDGDDFFERGGHSVSAMRLVAALREQLSRDVSVDDVFAARTLGVLRTRVAAAASVRHALPRAAAPRLTPSQRRLWFVDQLDPDGTAYNVAFAARVTGALEVDRLERAVATLAERHEVLRWRIIEQDGEPRPILGTSTAVLERCSVARGDLDDELGRRASRSFDLATGPLWSATVLEVSATENVLVLAFHHAIVDGWSQQPLFAEIGALYRGESLDAPAQFGDYAEWRAERDQGRGADVEWWRQHLDSAPVVLDLPHDRARPAVATSRGVLQSLAFDDESDRALRAVAGGLSTSPAMVVLGALGEALRRLTGHHDLLLAGITSDRPFQELEQALGFFVDIVPYRLRLDPDATFAEGVRGAQREVLAAAAHPGAALQDIVRAVRPRRDPSRAPLVQVAYNVYNFPAPALDLGPAAVCDEMPVPVPGSPFDLTVYLAQRDGRHVIDLVHNPDLFDSSRIRETGEQLLRLLRDASDTPQTRMADLPGDFWTAGVAPQAPPTAPRLAGDGAAPRTPTEEQIAVIWQTVLGERPPVTSNFFDAGGDSLAITRVVHLLGRRLDRSIPVVAAFQYPTVRDLAAHLDRAYTGGDSPSGAVPTDQSDAINRAEAIAAARRSRTRRRSRA